MGRGRRGSGLGFWWGLLRGIGSWVGWLWFGGSLLWIEVYRDKEVKKRDRYNIHCLMSNSKSIYSSE